MGTSRGTSPRVTGSCTPACWRDDPKPFDDLPPAPHRRPRAPCGTPALHSPACSVRCRADVPPDVGRAPSPRRAPQDRSSSESAAAASPRAASRSRLAIYAQGLMDPAHGSLIREDHAGSDDRSGGRVLKGQTVRIQAIEPAPRLFRTRREVCDRPVPEAHYWSRADPPRRGAARCRGNPAPNGDTLFTLPCRWQVLAAAELRPNPAPARIALLASAAPLVQAPRPVRPDVTDVGPDLICTECGKPIRGATYGRLNGGAVHAQDLPVSRALVGLPPGPVDRRPSPDGGRVLAPRVPRAGPPRRAAGKD